MAVDLQAIRDRLEAVTPGPWTLEPVGVINDRGYIIAGALRERYGDNSLRFGEDRATGKFVAHAPTDIAALLTGVDILRAQLRNKEACALRELEAQCRAEELEAERDELAAEVARLREELAELELIATPRRTPKKDRELQWLHGSWVSFEARAKQARAAATKWAREADLLEAWAAKRKAEKERGEWPYSHCCQEHHDNGGHQ